MSILLDKNTRVIVTGITGREGKYHTANMLKAGTRLVGGVTPGKGGQTVEGVPVFDTVAEAIAATGANAACIFVPPAGAADDRAQGRKPHQRCRRPDTFQLHHSRHYRLFPADQQRRALFRL